jgi:hypothetical protein
MCWKDCSCQGSAGRIIDGDVDVKVRRPRCQVYFQHQRTGRSLEGKYVGVIGHVDDARDLNGFDDGDMTRAEEQKLPKSSLRKGTREAMIAISSCAFAPLNQNLVESWPENVQAALVVCA